MQESANQNQCDNKTSFCWNEKEGQERNESYHN